MIPDLVIFSGRDGRRTVTRAEIDASLMEHLPGRPDLLVAEDRIAGDSIADGELPGARHTMDRLIRQEVEGGCAPSVAEAQVRRVTGNYDRSVRSGTEPYPLRRD